MQLASRCSVDPLRSGGAVVQVPRRLIEDAFRRPRKETAPSTPASLSEITTQSFAPGAHYEVVNRGSPSLAAPLTGSDR
jgi:hypothetical protein